MDADAKTKAVEERHGGQHLVAGPEHGIGCDDLLGKGVEVFVGQYDAFGRSGGAAGIENDGGVFGFALYFVIIEAVPGELHEFAPADDRRFLRDLLDLPSFRQHVAGPDGS